VLRSTPTEQFSSIPRGSRNSNELVSNPEYALTGLGAAAWFLETVITEMENWFRAIIIHVWAAKPVLACFGDKKIPRTPALGNRMKPPENCCLKANRVDNVLCLTFNRQCVRAHDFAGSYNSTNDPRLHFGLGGDGVMSEIQVRWPSGLMQRFSDVTGDAIYEIKEGEGIKKVAQLTLP
jgi:hypothetical protein